ncbi:MAG: hypothetical protein MI861_12095, partial [Pirellulales bacterium]|nr:hypothetical protein [Pirellulales bacterium]
MSASISNHKLPAAIEGKLCSVRWRHALLAAARSLAIGTCVLICLMILSMAIDWAFPFMDVAARIMLTLGTLAATTIVLAAVGIRPILIALGWDQAASAVDDEIPELEERWSTVASLAARDQASETPVARAMA